LGTSITLYARVCFVVCKLSACPAYKCDDSLRIRRNRVVLLLLTGEFIQGLDRKLRQ